MCREAVFCSFFVPFADAIRVVNTNFPALFVIMLIALAGCDRASPTPQNWLGELKLYLICIGACALLALITGIQLGTHKERNDGPECSTVNEPPGFMRLYTQWEPWSLTRTQLILIAAGARS